MKSSEEDQGYSVVLTFRVIDGWGKMGGRVGLSGGGGCLISPVLFLSADDKGRCQFE